MTYSPQQLNRVEPTYLSSYGLTEAPFSPLHEDRFLYLNPELSERLELIKHYTQYGNLLLIITGERGIGKSSLKQRFITTAQEEWKICEIQSHTMMDAGLLLKQVAQGFGITEPPLDPSALYDVLSNQLENLHQSANVPILIIDDAHELPKDALQALLYLAENHSDQHTALRIILFCEPEIDVMLEDPAIHLLQERVTHSMEIPALDETETAEYLRHRLAVAGLDGTSPFIPKLIHKIFLASNGIPDKINEYAHENLLNDSEPYTPDALDLDEKPIQNISSFNLRNTILIGIFATLVLAGFYFQEQINRLFEEEPASITNIKKEDANQQAENIEQQTEITPKVEAPKAELPEPTEEIKNKTIEFSLNKTKPAKEKETVTTTHKAASIKLTSVNPNPVPASKQRQIISISGVGFNKKQKVKISWTGKEKILASNQVNITSDTYMNLILNVGMNTDTWDVTLIDPELKIESNTIQFTVVAADKKSTTITPKAEIKTAPAKEIKQPLKTVTKNNLGLYGESWIQQQNKNHFTLQLLGSHDKQTLPKYIKKYSLNKSAAIFKTTRKDKDWYTLVYNQFPSKEAAQKAAKQLPKGMSQPWIRSFASILPSLAKTKTQVKKSIVTSPSSIPDNKDGWLWSQDPSHYTLQLTAGADKAAIESFIKRHNLKDKAVYFHRLRDSKNWYILIYGSYSGYSKAKQAIKELPAAVQKVKPWTRTFGAIHTELN